MTDNSDESHKRYEFIELHAEIYRLRANCESLEAIVTDLLVGARDLKSRNELLKTALHEIVAITSDADTNHRVFTAMTIARAAIEQENGL
jgi:hypothetical protein